MFSELHLVWNLLNLLVFFWPKMSMSALGSIKLVVTWLNPAGVNHGQMFLTSGCVWFPSGSERGSHKGSSMLLGLWSLPSSLRSRATVNGQCWGPFTLSSNAPAGSLAPGFKGMLWQWLKTVTRWLEYLDSACWSGLLSRFGMETENGFDPYSSWIVCQHLEPVLEVWVSLSQRKNSEGEGCFVCWTCISTEALVAVPPSRHAK